jgi:tryptophan synthase alpha chain
VSLTGVTGTRDKLPQELEGFVSKVRHRARQPLCVGFGISTPDEAHRVARVADGVIVGSRLVQLIEEENPARKVRSFVQALREALSDQTGHPAGN